MADIATTEIPIRQEPRFSWLWQLLRDPLGCFGLVLVLLIIISAAGADFIAPYDYKELNVKVRLASPSWDHLLGTDNLGRDTFSRILHGGQIALYVALVSVGSSLLLGIVLGMLAGYGPSWLDNTLMWIFDSVRAFPVIMFALAVITVVGPSLETIIFVVIATTTRAMPGLPGHRRWRPRTPNSFSPHGRSVPVCGELCSPISSPISFSRCSSFAAWISRSSSPSRPVSPSSVWA